MPGGGDLAGFAKKSQKRFALIEIRRTFVYTIVVKTMKPVEMEEECLYSRKETSSLPPYKRALISLLYTAYQMSDRLNEQLKPFDLSEQQVNVLHILKKQKEKACNLCDIQDQMMHKMSNATRLVEKLRLKGLVSREICEDNRRRVEITITDKGLKMLERIEHELQGYHLVHESKLSEEEYIRLADLLDKMRE
jgi:DNA-binding MarR family transcriptional regulator